MGGNKAGTGTPGTGGQAAPVLRRAPELQPTALKAQTGPERAGGEGLLPVSLKLARSWKRRSVSEASSAPPSLSNGGADFWCRLARGLVLR
jgi:hypothetical protein